MRLKTHDRWMRLAFAVVLGSAATGQAADHPDKVQSLGPVYYWRLNDKPAVPAADKAANLGSLGAAADGFYAGTVNHPSAGGVTSPGNSGAEFDATAGTGISIPYSAELNPNGPFTVEAWLNPSGQATTAAPTCAVSSGQFSNPRSGWLIYQVDTGWNFRMYNQNGTATSVSVVGGSAPEVGMWYHVVAVYDGSSAVVYVNGAPGTAAAPTGYVPSAGGRMLIGGRADSSFWWPGVADEVAVYGRALTATEIDAHFKNGTAASPTTGYQQLVLSHTPLVYYRLNEQAYTPPSTLPAVKNLGSAGTSGDGSWNPGADSQAAGPRPPGYAGFESDNTAVGLNGNIGHVSTPASLNDLAQFTVSGWIKRGAQKSGRGGYFGQNDLLEFGDADNGANIEAWINAYGTNIKIPFPFRDDQWGLITLVGDGTSATLYTNGLPAATVQGTVDTYGASSFVFNIGGGGVFNATGDYFLGGIDEVTIFDKALTAQQVSELYFSANIAPSIVAQPKAPDRELSEGNAATLSVSATGTPPLTYQWRKGGQALPGKTSAELSFSSVTTADAGSYDVVISNAFGSVTSSAVTLTIKAADTIAPVLQYAAGNAAFTGVRVWFSEPLDAASAQNAANYSVSGGLTVTSATLAAPPGSPGDNIVNLVTSAQTPGATYTLTVNGVKDQAAPANPVASGSTVTFYAWTLAQGYLAFEHWDNITGAADSDIDKGLADPRVIAGKPTTTGFITGRLDSRTVFPDDSHEQYLARMTGYLTPTESGNYYFFVRSDDASRVYLSTTEAIPNPATATPIAIETGCCGTFAEPESGDPATTPTPIALQAGKRYGLLILLKEGGGGDWLGVAWRKDSDTTEAVNLPYLPSQYFASYVDPNAEIAIVEQPANQVGVLPSPVVDFATANFATAEGGYTVENTDPAPPGPFSHQASIGWVADGGEANCTGPYNSRLNSPAYTVPQTEEVTLTFTHRYSFEGDYWDGGQVRISVNGGAFTPVNPDNFTANGYATGLIQGSGAINGQRAFNGDSPGYAAGTFITSSVILGAFKQGDTITVQFLGAWDECTTGSVPGWVIQSAKLAYGTAPRAVIFQAAATATRQGNPTTHGYQWQRNDGSGFVNIPNATTASYRFFPVAADFDASFRVLATIPGRSVASTEAKLVTTAEPPSVGIMRAGAGATVTYTGTLQSAPAVQGPYSNVAGASSPYTVPATSGTVFFRAVR